MWGKIASGEIPNFFPLVRCPFKQKNNTFSFLSVNLSIADTMVSSLNVTFNYVYMLNGHWPFGNIYCKVCSFISIISVCASVFTLVAISTDRYLWIFIIPSAWKVSHPAKIDLDKKWLPKQKTIQNFNIDAQGLRKTRNENPLTLEIGVTSQPVPAALPLVGRSAGMG